MDIFLARQPIFDQGDQLVGYELLYRRDAQRNLADGETPLAMSADVIVKAILGVGLDRLTGTHRAFINFSREMLVDHVFDLLPASRIVVEILETVPVDAAALDACEQLRGQGYTIALDDYEIDPGRTAFLPFASIIKVNVLGRSVEELTETVAALRAEHATLLAERVETKEQRDACRELGFTLFQGYYYSRPEMIAHRGIAVSKLALLELLNQVRNPAMSDAEIEGTFRGDPALSHKLLRIVNSAAMGGRGIESIRYAVQLIGRQALHRWLALILLSSFAGDSGIDAELVHLAVMRARACELIAEQTGRRQQASALFMVGLFSTLDALLKLPMQDLLARLDLVAEIKSALLGTGGPYSAPLKLVEAYETGHWDAMARLSPEAGVEQGAMSEVYLESLSWAREILTKVNEA